MDFLDLDGLKTFKNGCDASYDKKSFLSNRSSRMTTLDIDFSSNAENHRSSIGVFSSNATSSPGYDGHVINMPWDNSKWGSQFCIRDGTTPTIAARTVTGVSGDSPTWSPWATILTNVNTPAITTAQIQSLF